MRVIDRRNFRFAAVCGFDNPDETFASLQFVDCIIPTKLPLRFSLSGFEQLTFHCAALMKDKLFISRGGRNRTCHSRFYPSVTGFEDQLEHQSRPLYILTRFIWNFFGYFLTACSNDPLIYKDQLFSDHLFAANYTAYITSFFPAIAPF